MSAGQPLGTPSRARLRTTVPACVALGAAAAWALDAIAPVRAEPRLAWDLVALALSLALVAPSFAAPSLRRTLGHLAATVLAAVATLCALGALALGAAPGVALYLALFGAALVTLRHALGDTLGPPLAILTGLLALAAPYGLDPVLAPLPDLTRLQLTMASPLTVLCGSFAGFDILRSPTLYEQFPLGQSLPYAYMAPSAALVPWAVATAVFGAVVAARRKLAIPRGAVVALAFSFVLFDAEPAQAQLFNDPQQSGPNDAVGDLVTRVSLGYWLTDLDGSVTLDGKDGRTGARLGFDRSFDLRPIFLVPTFDVAFTFENGGKIGLQYAEGQWNGEDTNFGLANFEEQTIEFNNLLEAEYKYRTIALIGELYLPALDFLNIRLITTQRYVKHSLRVRALPQGFSGKNTLEVLVPSVGAGVDFQIWGVISGYADLQWLDFRTSVFGTGNDRWDFRYREWHVGARLELIEHAHFIVEWFSLETRIVDGNRETFQQDLNGFRFQISVLF